MKINRERLEALLLEMLAGLKDSTYDNVTMCILERDGMQVQVKVTSDQNEFMGIVTTGVIDEGPSNAARFEDFLDQLKATGVIIDGEATLRAKVSVSVDWPGEVVRLAEVGRKDGVRFWKNAANAPSVERLDAIVRGYPFTDEARRHLIGNIAQL